MPFQPPDVLLLGPGPSPTSAAVRSAQALPLLGHLDPSFLPLLDTVQQGLRSMFGTTNQLTLPLAGTGTAGMEAMVANLIEPGDRVVIGVHGVFGQRFAESARRAGAEVVEVRAEFGRSLDPELVAQAVVAGPTRLVGVVHAETSTGVRTELLPMVAAARSAGALFVADCVTSLAGLPIELDRLGIDAAFSGTQKCLSAPPGLTPVSFGPRALARVQQRRTPVPFYFDTRLLTGYFGPDRAYHYTAPISMLYALHAAVEEVQQEGLAARIERHAAVAAALRRGLPALGLEALVPPEHATPMLTTIRCPAGVDDRAFRAHLRQVHGIEVGGGLGPLAGRVFRVGLMGHGARLPNVLRALAAFGDALAAAGQRVDVAASLTAARGS
ncbi:MAG: alanine--glyoxylate aminotransferase family protein [Planctomycetes bacterium]|jgi:alanine-glyoxylate transaminase/serine-glyoxylate transaminase/serine-pyruvate transaminase|nr:alanine--glyoxylate aminotransferase family protein [Planctomycetota bacterium]